MLWRVKDAVVQSARGRGCVGIAEVRPAERRRVVMREFMIDI